MIKKILAMLFLPLIMCGCNRNSDNEQVTLKFSTWGTASEINIIKELIKDYEAQHPEIKITLIHTPQNYFKKLHLQFASKTEPDIILINNQNIERYGKFLITFDDKEFKNVFFHNAIKGLSLNNELKAIPRDISILVIYYNKTLLNNNYIPLPPREWNMNDFLTIAKRLKNKNIFTIPLEDDLFYTYPFIMSNGESPETINIENLKNYSSIDFYKSLSLKHHYAPQNYELGAATGCEFFLNGKSAFLLSGRWVTPKLREYAQFDWDILPFPAGKAGSLAPCDATGWGISKRTKHLKESAEFVNYLSSEKALNKMTSTGIIVPARKNCANSNIFYAPPPQNSKLFITLAENAIPIKYPSNYDYTRDKINNLLKTYKQEKPDRETELPIL